MSDKLIGLYYLVLFICAFGYFGGDIDNAFGIIGCVLFIISCVGVAEHVCNKLFKKGDKSARN